MAQKQPVIDEKGLEAAEVAWRASVEPTCKLMLRTAIRAYLAAPTPDQGGGLEVVAWGHPTAGWAQTKYHSVLAHCRKDGPGPVALVRRSQASSLLAERGAEIERLNAELEKHRTTMLQNVSQMRSRAEAAEAQVQRLTEDNEAACNDLRSFMTSFVREHFPDNTGWKPLPDLLGMLTQMDNASTIARDYKARIKALEEALGNTRCPRPCNHRPDEFDTKDCVAAGECGCGSHVLARAFLKGSSNSREKGE